MIYLDQTTLSTFACQNCKTVVTDQLDVNGKPITVWACENCGEENHVPTVDEQTAQAVIDSTITPPAPVLK